MGFDLPALKLGEMLSGAVGPPLSASLVAWLVSFKGNIVSSGAQKSA